MPPFSAASSPIAIAPYTLQARVTDGRAQPYDELRYGWRYALGHDRIVRVVTPFLARHTRAAFVAHVRRALGTPFDIADAERVAALVVLAYRESDLPGPLLQAWLREHDFYERRTAAEWRYVLTVFAPLHLPPRPTPQQPAYPAQRHDLLPG